MNPPTATPFASGMPNTNGLAFDRDGNLWTGDGTAGNGIVWMITPDGVVQEMFRVQPMVNGLGVGRSANTQPENRPQPLVANGLAFTPSGDLLIADTARGALWRVQFDRHGNIKSNIGCDTTFAPNTLCLDNIFVAHPFLEGADGFVLDQEGNAWVSANERNAVLVVTPEGEVSEVFRNPADSKTRLRNGGPLESPTSPYIDGLTLCTANSDGGRRDNNPSSGGEIGGPGQDKGKISCLKQKLAVPGLPLPIQ
jgi:sugar lactone lactonase YvrE